MDAAKFFISICSLRLGMVFQTGSIMSLTAAISDKLIVPSVVQETQHFALEAFLGNVFNGFSMRMTLLIASHGRR